MLLPESVKQGFIWINGETLPWDEASIHCITHGLHYGSCVFEGERSYNGKIFKSLEHTQRLFRSAEMLDMAFPYSMDVLEAAKYDVLNKSGLTDAYIRMFVWRGGEEMAISAPRSTINVAIASWAWPSYFGDKGETGLALKQSQWRKPAPDTAPVHAKAAGLYMIGTLSKHAAMKDGYNDTLMLDYRGLVAESSGANLFIVKDGVLKTPIPDCFLNGITRLTVIDLAKEYGMKVEEKHIEPDELYDADEVFLTGTAAEIAPVSKINDQLFEVGTRTKQLKKAYLDLTGATG